MKNIGFELDIVKTLKTVKKGDWIVFGYASTYDVDTDDTQITREALESAKNDLLKYSTVLFNHNMDRPIGKVIETEIDEIGLLVKIVLSKEEKEIWKKIQEGIINKFSIKGRTPGLEPVEGAGQINQINDIELFEVSLVSVPANVGAETISHYIAKSLQKNDTSNKSNMKELIKKLKMISKKTTDDTQEDLDNIIKDLEEKDDLLSSLHIIAGKLTEKDRQILESVIEKLKDEKKLSDKCNEFNLKDETSARPIFQLNSSDNFELDENPSKFRKQILKIGKLYHWAANGGVLNITSDIIDNIVKNFKKKVIDNVSIPLTHSDDPSKNTGEVIQLIKTEDGLDAVCEIKDESIAEKIRKNLIKNVSVSLDSNYRNKMNNKFVGPTLLHLALVAEPYIKRMRSFVSLADEFKDRHCVLLEDQEPDVFKDISEMKVEVSKIEETLEKQNELNEMFANILKENKDEDEDIEKSVLPYKKAALAPIVTSWDAGAEVKKASGDAVKLRNMHLWVDTSDKKHFNASERKWYKLPFRKGDGKQEIVWRGVAAAMAVLLGARGGINIPATDKKKIYNILVKYYKDFSKKPPVFKELDEQELKKEFSFLEDVNFVKDNTLETTDEDEKIEEEKKLKYNECMSREMKGGKNMVDSAKICKEKINKMIKKEENQESSEDLSEITLDKKSEETTQPTVDLVDVEKVYEKYLKQGKIVPAQKEAFIKLLSSKGAINLGENNQVELSDDLKAFLEAQPKIIDFDEKGQEKIDNQIEKKDESEMPVDVKEFYSKMGLSEENAKEAWEYAKGKTEQEKKEKESTIF